MKVKPKLDADIVITLHNTMDILRRRMSIRGIDHAWTRCPLCKGRMEADIVQGRRLRVKCTECEVKLTEGDR